MKSLSRRGWVYALVMILSVVSAITSDSIMVLAKETADQGAPSAPVNLSVVGSLSNQVVLNWDLGVYDTEAGLGFPDQFIVYRTEGVYADFSGSQPLSIVNANNKSFTDTTVKPYTTYHYKVAARLGDKESANSNLADVTTQQLPFAVEATALGASKVSITWNNAVPGVQKYNVYRAAAGSMYMLVGSTTALAYTDSGLVGNTYYAYSVRPVTASGEADGSLAYVTTLVADRASVPETAPVLQGNPVVPTINNLEWNRVEGAVSYAVYRAISGMTPVVLATTTKFGYPDMTVSPGYSYTYLVKAVNEYGESAPSNEVIIKTAALRAPVVNIATTGRNQISLAWAGSTDAQSYDVYKSVDGRNFSLASSVAGASLVFVDKDLLYETEYFYYVKARAGSSGVDTGEEGGKSVTVSAKTLGKYDNLPAPVLSGRALSKTSAEISWKAIPGATKYMLWRDYSNLREVGTGLFPGEGIIVTGTAYVDTQAFPLERYAYTVVALDESGASGLNAKVTVEVGAYKDALVTTENSPIVTTTAVLLPVSSPITFRLPTTGGDTKVYVRQNRTVRFSYTYKNSTSKPQRIRLVRQLIRPNGSVAETVGLFANPGANRSLSYSPAVTFSARASKGLYRVVIKAYDTEYKNYGKVLGENSFMIQVP